MKKMLNLSSGEMSFDDLTLSDVKLEIERLIEKYGDASKIDFLVRWDGDTNFVIDYERLETDAEYNNRQEREQDAEYRTKAERRKQYEQLKKEFGDNYEQQ